MAKPVKKKKQAKAPDSFMTRAGHVALDNPVAAGGTVVMGLTACLIVANAVGLQPGRHPAPLFATRDRSDALQLSEPGDRRGGLQIQEISTLVLDLQISLRKIGLYEGPLDGLNGPATERAIRAFERRAGQQETGEASEALLALVLMQGDAPVAGQMPVPRAKPGFSGTPVQEAGTETVAGIDADPRLMKIQKALSELGYGPLKADGLKGANTTMAIKRFELDRGLPLTGEPGAEVIERLEMISGRSLSG
ncbi:peptidoglycan-binding domain-containing protein [Roseibium marinum]|uniref:Peptidoglycan hydrolase-like protein with peptidoglycan-binding domain n=1 Tax=Roseibium marinum TaxID=281252 RepID=A0A2S3UVF9_9HYPH|nr:peptidoglycan-binding domain-containing protein [Roseibium marinum]POF31711.1 peptidoglycan hydrolase-like protein with peptidoglycan-binding domain [Roseibium marinum]